MNRHRLRSAACNIVHNCVVHPMLPFLPRRIGTRLHDASFELWHRDDPHEARVRPDAPVSRAPATPARGKKPL